MIQVGGKNYLEHELLKIIEFYEHFHKSPELNADIIHNIIRWLNFRSVMLFCSVNKFTYAIYKDETYWTNRIVLDFPSLMFDSSYGDATCLEKYRHAHESFTSATNLVDVLLRMHKRPYIKRINYFLSNNRLTHIYFPSVHITGPRLNMTDLYWLPEKIVDNENYGDKEYCYFQVLRNETKSDSFYVFVMNDEYNITKCELVNIFGMLFYKYPHITLEDDFDPTTSFLYEDLLDSEDTDEVRFRIKCWKKVLKKSVT